MSVALPEPLSLVAPAFWTGPEWEYTRGGEVAEFSDALGFILDPEQRLALDVMYAATGPNVNYHTMNPRWAAMEFSLIAPRQNLKTGVCKPAVLADCLLFGARNVLWTAHRRKTGMRTFRDLDELIEANAWLSRYVRQLHRSTGSEAIEFVGGQRIDFAVRSEAGDRGPSYEKVYNDEALFLTAEQRAATQPTMAAIPNPMVANMSSPGLQESDELRAIRDRGRSGDPTMGYLEWASTKACEQRKCRHELGARGCVADDEAEWAKANPALGRRISVEFLRASRRSLATKPEKFMTEHMGHWPDGGRSSKISVVRWMACGSEDSSIDGPVVVAVDMALDRSSSVVVVCGPGRGGLPQAEVALMAHGSEWVAEKVKAMMADHDVLALAARSRGAITSLVPDLRRVAEDAGVDFHKVSTGEHAAFCGLLQDKVRDQALIHLNDSRVIAALKDAKPHRVAEAWEWEREDVDTDAAPLVATTCAVGVWDMLHAAADSYDPLANIW